MNYAGYKSRKEMVGVHVDMVILNITALTTMPRGYDYATHDGLRTLPEQRENIARGVSWTEDSMHLPQWDGWGHALDLVPIVDGKLSWEDRHNKKRQRRITDTFNFIADRMKKAGNLHKIEFDWGFDLWGKDWAHFQLANHYRTGGGF